MTAVRMKPMSGTDTPREAQQFRDGKRSQECRHSLLTKTVQRLCIPGNGRFQCSADVGNPCDEGSCSPLQCPENGKKSLVPFHGFVVNAVVPNQSIGHIHAAHASVVVHHSVRNGNNLSLPHTSLFHFPPDSLSTEGCMHCGAHGHFTAVHPLHKQELASPYPTQISPFSLFRNQKMQREAELVLVQTSGGVAWMLMALGQLYADLMHVVARMRQMLMAVIQKPFDMVFITYTGVFTLLLPASEHFLQYLLTVVASSP
ncbi:hypothetical protein F7725_005103 [Dissostichus mawsoni]|uniref:Uncharacterized protein n=1 Tax=Dissostichus mawsoni TaxID=36200 RepID=A0A7J5YUB6_DISMA|nr:hypothetical protein F7725_005103 [Dissostichus mawsoni]